MIQTPVQQTNTIKSYLLSKDLKPVKISPQDNIIVVLDTLNDNKRIELEYKKVFNHLVLLIYIY